MIRRVRKAALLLGMAALTSMQAFGAQAGLGRPFTTDFGLKLFNNISANDTGNVLISPASAHLALSMAANGAAGATLSEMTKVLGVSPGALDALNEHNHAVIKTLGSNKTVQLDVANAIYADKHTPFNTEFINTCSKIYEAEAHNEDFASQQTVQHINNWCKEKTHGKIASILDRLSPDAKMVLLNAVYFKGTWQEQFRKESTVDDEFVSPSGKAPIKMMHEPANFQYYKGTNFESVILPYAGGKQSMYVFLPGKKVDMPAFIGQLTKANWEKWRQSYDSKEVNLSLPRFRIEYEKTLNDPLKESGMPQAFDPQKADFSKMISQRAWIGLVVQKTYMDVREEGTEAAAVTGIEMATSAYHPQPEVVQFRVDRPFVVALVDNDTGEFLFLGKIMKP